MSTPTPDAATVVADVHKVLDTAKADAQAAIAGLGVLSDEARQLVHDGLEVLKQRVHDLIHGVTPPPAV